MIQSKQVMLNWLIHNDGYVDRLISQSYTGDDKNTWWVKDQMRKMIDRLIKDSETLTRCNNCKGNGSYMEDDIRLGNRVSRIRKHQVYCDECKGSGII